MKTESMIIKCVWCFKTHDIYKICKAGKKARADSHAEYKRRFGNKNVFEAIKQVMAELRSEIRGTN